MCQRQPDCHVLIIGGDKVSYGRANKDHQTYKEQMLAEVKID